MELTERERQLIEVAKEEILLMIPEVVGNMITQNMSLNKLNSEFYSSHPEFVEHKDAVRSVTEMVEGENPLLEYNEILKKSVPKIRERISTLKKLDMKNVTSKPSLTFKKDLHGDL
jgi:hypothetical protein